MKRLVYMILALAIVGCEGLMDKTVIVGEYKDDSEEVKPLFPAGTDVVDDIAQPKGALKSIEKITYDESSTTKILFHTITTIIYDEIGRPLREDVIAYDYENGVALGTSRNSHTYYFYSPGKMEARTGENPDRVFRKVSFNSDGLVGSVDVGYMKNGSWISESNWQVSYNSLEPTAITYLRGNNRPWEYSWSSDGLLLSAKETWSGPIDPDEDETEYYTYGSTVNPTYKQAYDISGIIFSKISEIGGYYFNGHGSAKLPVSARTSYRNEARKFTYTVNNGQVTQISISWWPFADDDPMVNNFHHYVYKLNYYN